KSVPKAILGDILPHWYDALKLDAGEQAAFETALHKLNTERNAVLASKTKVEFDDSSAHADEAYAELEGIVKGKGNPQAGVKLSGVMSLLNLLCLYFVWDSTPDKWNPLKWGKKTWADISSVGVASAAGICSTLVRMQVNIGVMKNFIEHPAVGIGIGV